MTAGATARPSTCESCLRRLRLVGLLAPFIERAATREPGRRSPQLLALDDDQLALAVAGGKAEGLLAEAGLGTAEEQQRLLDESGCWAVCRHDESYPQSLRDLGDAPPALVGRGAPTGLARLSRDGAVTVVGARRATSYGREVARRLAGELGRSGFAVVSGLAWGIDGAAHEGALEGGFSVAVLGCGADIAYPRHHAALYERLVQRGLVLSELPPGTVPWRWAFPARNRIMAALGGMTVVVEAAGRSGSLITSELASELGRDIGAVPGPIGARMSVGTNQLLVDGARVVRGAEDVLDALLGAGSRGTVVRGPPLDTRLAAVLERVEDGDRDGDSIALSLDCSGESATGCLAELELLGYVTRSFAGTYSRTSLDVPLPDRDAESGRIATRFGEGQLASSM